MGQTEGVELTELTELIELMELMELMKFSKSLSRKTKACRCAMKCLQLVLQFVLQSVLVWELWPFFFFNVRPLNFTIQASETSKSHGVSQQTTVC